MQLFLLTLFLPAVVLSGPLDYPKECSLGPPYWCSHVSHARVCGATQHCLQTVWKFQTVQPTSTKTCTYCQLIVNEVRDALKDEATEEKIASVLTNVCAILPTADDRDLCKGVITDYAPELLKMFVNDVSTDMICAALDLCSGLNNQWGIYNIKPSNNTNCTDCMKFFQDVQASITSKETQDELEQVINQTICSQLGGFSGVCNDFVKSYMPVFLKALADQIDPSIVCRVFGFCTSEWKNVDVIKIKNIFKERKSTAPLKYRSDEECELCKDLFNQIVEALRDKTVQDKVRYELETVVCHALGSYEAECRQLVEEYLPELFELLVNELDPKTVCETVGLCTVPSRPKVVLASEVVPAEMVGQGYVKESELCTLCKYFMLQVDNFLKQNGTIKEFEDIIDKICIRLPTKHLQTQCDAFVKEYGQFVVDELAKELEPKMICDAINICKNSTGPVQPIKSQRGCSVCVFLIKEVETLLENISTDTLMKDLRNVCSYIPGNYSALCLKYVNEYGPLVINLLKSKEDPKSLCQLAQMCSASSKKIGMTKPIPEETATISPECEVCGTVIMTVKNLLESNETREAVKQVLADFCDELPSEVKSTCSGLVQTYGDQLIIYFLKKLNATAICIDLGLCKGVNLKARIPFAASVIMSPYDTLPVQQPMEKKKVLATPITCEICTVAIETLKTFIGTKETKAEVKKALGAVCTKLPVEIQSSCNDFVSQYGDRIVDLILKDIDAKAVCTELDLCKSSKKKSYPLSVVMSPYDTLPIVEDDKELKKTESPEICFACKKVLDFVEKEIQDNKTEESIKAALKEACSVLPTSMQEECTQLVNEYTDSIIKYFILGYTPEKICEELTLCPGTVETKKLPEPVHVKLLKTKPRLEGVKASSVVCDVCKLVVNFVDVLAKQNTTEEEIKNALENFCDLMPDTIKAECSVFVDKYAQIVINLLVHTVADPSRVCINLRLCNESASTHLDDSLKNIPEKKTETTDIKAGPVCILCEYVMEKLDSILTQNKSEAAVEAALDKVCDLFPDTIKNECTSFVSQYGPQIIKLLVNELDPKAICTVLKLCTAELMSPLATLVKILPEEKTKAQIDYCGPCKWFFGELKTFLEENRTAEELEGFLDRLCDELPDTVTVQCHDGVRTYVPAIIALVDQGLDPTQICQQFGICQAQKQKEDKKDDDTLFFKPQRMVGTSKCTYGPSYWCASKEKAVECNAVEHCMKHVWN